MNPDKRRMLPRRPGISWTVGAKVEAMDFLKKWLVIGLLWLISQLKHCILHLTPVM